MLALCRRALPLSRRLRCFISSSSGDGGGNGHSDGDEPPSLSSSADETWMLALDLVLEGCEDEEDKLRVLEAQRRRTAFADWRRFEAGQSEHLARAYFLHKARKHDMKTTIRVAWLQMLEPEPRDWSTLEQCLLLLSQWDDPQFDILRFQTQLDELTAVARKRLELLPPSPALPAPPIAAAATAAAGAAEPLAWVPVMNDVFFKELRFEFNSLRPYDPRNSLLHHVVERRTGIQLALCTVYGLIAHRLGYSVALATTPTHAVLRAGPMVIDVAEGGRLMRPSDVFMAPHPEPVATLSTRQALVRTMTNVIHAYMHLGRFQEQALGYLEHLLFLDKDNQLRITRLGLVLQLMVSPHYRNHAHFYRIAKMDMEHFSLHKYSPTVSRYIQEMSDRFTKVVQYRDSGAFDRSVKRKRLHHDVVKFKIGMLVHNPISDYRGVVIGWHPQMPPDTSRIAKTWNASTSNLDEPPGGKNQPFYEVLVDGGITHLSPAIHTFADAIQEPVNSHLVGRYFRAFRGGRYLPCAWMLLAYPNS